MDYRHVTPPSDDEYSSMQCTGGSASTQASYYPHNWSPETVTTAATTPPRSPYIIRESGSRLLPKPRDQDQIIEHGPNVAGFHDHSRTSSLPANTFAMQFGSAIPQYSDINRGSASPRGRAQALSPAPSAYGHLQPESASHRPTMTNIRSVSASHISSVRSHSRNVSSSSIDASMLSRYGYPTYRQSPTPQPLGCGISMSRTPSAMSHLAPIAMPNGQVQSYPNGRRTASPPANSSRLSVEADIPDDTDLSTSTVLEYLTAPNPTPSLIQKITETNKLQNNHFWFDVRNIRSWSDFNIDTIATIPGLLDLLKVDISTHHLPTPTPVSLSPESPAHLSELCANHHAIKVNAALKIAQGDKHIAMRTWRPMPGSRQQPEFVANYQSDGEKTIYGEGRGRVVGIVKSYDQWNSGYRNGSPIDKIKYLEHLAHLHRFMREHGTRYGFIMTEIELVCVRMGGPSTADNIPLFGFLEVAPSIQISAHGTAEDGALRMTVGLALWYVHMLAKEQPFPNQYHWRLDVGGPAAMTRKHHLPRDDWLPKVNQQDKRVSKRIRGWIWPDEPLHKRECGKGKRK
ncbi:hypothetical protein DOTSEDRAFT_55400 [Dothistroma septosporum NZE10]|uniref:Sialidase n=1 Tax=Dothistroma septosporum (strain NZE10 / CBS 128990) TaxID=675120 RepID=N1PGZ1_DOTSN|nr:hypothetical protein DOTSEDRAFT_55400 [Dothistroma septosporum NZE10]